MRLSAFCHRPPTAPPRRSPEFPIPTLLLLGGSLEAEEPWRPEPRAEPLPQSPNTGRRQVLVAEDDAMVAGLIERLLVEEGYEVRLARHGEEALHMALRGNAGPDLVITDVRMPVMDGWELSRRLGERWPDVPVLYISGYDVELTHASARRGRGAFLRKPFDPDELIRHVNRLLGRR